MGSIVIVVGYLLLKDYLDNRDHDYVDENQQILDEQRGQIEDNQEQIEENKEAINELKDQLNKKFLVGLGVLLAILIIIFFVKPLFLNKYRDTNARKQQIKKGSSLAQLGDFQNFPIIRSRTADKLFYGDSARGDGYCSIWSILIGWSLLNRDKLIINENFLTGSNQPTNMRDLVNIIINTAETLKKLMGENKSLKIDEITFFKGELDILIYQLELPEEEVFTIQGRAQFQILALLLGVEIKVHDEVTNTFHTIGNPKNDTIRVSTNGKHYHVRNNKQNNNLDHFINRYWWDLQWKKHPIIKEKDVIAYIG